MLKDHQRIIRKGRTVVADYQGIDGERSGVVEITIYKDGKLIHDQVFMIPFRKLREIYDNYRKGNRDSYTVSGSLNEGVELKYGKRLRIKLKPREIYDIIVQGERVKRQFKKDNEKI